MTTLASALADFLLTEERAWFCPVCLTDGPIPVSIASDVAEPVRPGPCLTPGL